MFSLTELFKLNDYFNLFCYKKPFSNNLMEELKK